MLSGLLHSPIDGHEGQSSGHLHFVGTVDKSFGFSEGFNHVATMGARECENSGFKKDKESWRLNHVILFSTVNKWDKYQEEIVMIRFVILLFMCVERFMYVFSVKIYRVGSGKEEKVTNILHIL